MLPKDRMNNFRSSNYRQETQTILSGTSCDSEYELSHKRILKKPDLGGRKVARAIELFEYDITYSRKINISHKCWHIF